MPIPAGYDVGLQHSAVNGGVDVGFFLDGSHDEPFVEEQTIVTHVDVTTGGVTSVASFGLGVKRYRLRLQLATEVLDRSRRGRKESPADNRARILEFAAKTDGLVKLQMALDTRYVGFEEAVRFISGPALDGYIALLTLVDLGAA